MDLEQLNTECGKILEEFEKKKDDYKTAVKRAFWSNKGYPKRDTHNSAIIEEGIDFAIEATLRLNTRIQSK